MKQLDVLGGVQYCSSAFGETPFYEDRKQIIEKQLAVTLHCDHTDSSIFYQMFLAFHCMANNSILK